MDANVIQFDCSKDDGFVATFYPDIHFGGLLLYYEKVAEKKCSVSHKKIKICSMTICLMGANKSLACHVGDMRWIE